MNIFNLKKDLFDPKCKTVQVSGHFTPVPQAPTPSSPQILLMIGLSLQGSQKGVWNKLFHFNSNGG